MIDRDLGIIFAIVAGVLLLAGVFGFIMKRRATSPKAKSTIDNFNARTRSWVGMVVVLAIAVLCGKLGVLLLFALISFLALREFITLVPTRRADHRTLFWVFFILVPVQTILLWRGELGIFLVTVPVYSFLLLAFRSAIVGDTTNYLSRAATVFWAAMICVFCIGHAPALLLLHVPGFEPRENVKLLLFLLIVVQFSDVLQYCWGKMLGKHPLTKVSPNKTWEGFIGGVLSASLLGMALSFATPFTWWQAWLLALMVAVLGTAGGIVASAIKRDANVKDYGSLIEGHGGVMDRIDSLSFAAPVFFPRRAVLVLGGVTMEPLEYHTPREPHSNLSQSHIVAVILLNFVSVSITLFAAGLLHDVLRDPPPTGDIDFRPFLAVCGGVVSLLVQVTCCLFGWMVCTAMFDDGLSMRWRRSFRAGLVMWPGLTCAVLAVILGKYNGWW